MPKPERYAVKKLVRFESKLMAAVDKWRRKEPDLPNQTEAIRRLVGIGLRARKK
jgi:hypothetical protein